MIDVSFWKAPRVTRRKYPGHGTPQITGGRLKGETDTDYFHFLCPNCGPDETLDVELLGLRDDCDKTSPYSVTIMLGLHCQKCKLTDLVKISPLEKLDLTKARLDIPTPSNPPKGWPYYQCRPVCRRRGTSDYDGSVIR